MGPAERRCQASAGSRASSARRNAVSDGIGRRCIATAAGTDRAARARANVRHRGRRNCARDATFGGSANISSGLPSLVIVDFVDDHARQVRMRRQVVHDVEQHLLEDRAQAARAGLARERLARRSRAARRSRISSSTPSMRNIFWYCLISAFFGSTRIWISAASSSSSSVATTGSRPTNSGIRPNLIRSSGSVSRSSSRHVLAVVRARTSAPKPMPVFAVRWRMIFSRPSNAPPQTNRMLVVSTCTNSWFGCLRPPCGGTRRDRALDQLQERLLHAFARHVARDRRVVALARDLVDLVDVDDAALRLLDVVVALLQQLLDDVLDVLADVARFGERRRVGDHERDVEQPRQRLREQRLAGAGGADQQDVRLRELDLVVLAAGLQPLVVVVDGDREDLLRRVLADHVLVEDLADLVRRRQLVLVGARGFSALRLPRG